ncbi:bacillithiol biosynthesis deacetylase BshB2 [Paenibacillus sp.]|uniref:bacillithiol biosynthesis deacetylase BshB2 n=1 Tax=Paenibacillus sp. TaxID=58172 RepID=UPI002D5DDB92|nr:bacillithiol biosynthesis deacetylase BshB2 [Paenibacillus sp.]HZG86356.1 bacillithiol biosynthesis deacetylase BshB2 [Paenibacillus sp.]
MEERRILVVLPHPDDEAFGLSGTLAKLIREGARVTYACLTLGQMGRNMGIPPFASRVTLPDIRRQELEESCRAIGIHDVRMLGFHDKMLEFEDRALLDGAIAELLKEIRPTLVFTFYPGYSVHPDHDATGAAVVRAVGQLPPAERPPVHCMAFAKNTREDLGEPDIAEFVGPFMEQKLASIYAHRTQFQAAELVGNKTMDEIVERFGTERFWIYRFEE